ncbi:MarR family winged helix-turn-helix transcriptional regulator [Stappia sp. ES.058]|uniref:MarR family winged helix-turn-helix transcriptional regulator n=1 Tax=Stappia sp. ES.058 TaxID=1881061 RepID=UPI00087B8FB0|nr:MarR family transcriptional regulator [Stappia sp. ES.058]SDU41155.1 DNA-binding transcriptional regulator, MarR family [Stappia sp. ES.058]
MTGTGRFVDGYLLYLLARASSVASAEFHQEVRAQGVSIAVWRILASLKGTKKGLTVGELAHSCLAQQPAISKTVEKLVIQGLVERHADSGDRRRVWVRLTPAGEERADVLIAGAMAHQGRLLEALGPDNADVLKTALTQLIDRAP